MTVTNSSYANEYVSNGVTVAYPYTFKISSSSWLVAYTRPTALDSWTITTDYTLSGVGVDSGGTLTFNSPITNTHLIRIERTIPLTQETDYVEGDRFPAASHEAALDKLTMLIQNIFNTALKYASSTDSFSALNKRISSLLTPVNPTDAATKGYVDTSIGDAPGYAATASSAAATATTQAGIATTQAGIATTQASIATSAAASASATLAAALWRDVVFITPAASPLTITSADSGKLFVCDTTSGAITINAPQISTITTPFNFGVKLEAGGNPVTINRAGTDLIGAATSKTISTLSVGAQFIADTDPAPDVWTALDFGGGVSSRQYARIVSQSVQDYSTIFVWQQTVLTHEVVDTGDNIVLSSNRLTIQPGTYSVRAYRMLGLALSGGSRAGAMRFRDPINNITYALGIAHDCTAGIGGLITLDARLVLASVTTLEMQLFHHSSIAAPTSLLSSGETPFYAQIEFWKEF